MARDEEANLRKRVLAAAAFIKLTRAADSTLSRIHVDLESVDMTFSQFAILEVLYNKGPLRLDEIGVKMLKGRGDNLADLVAGLEGRGLVRQIRVSEDYSSVVIELTAEGHELLQDFLPQHLKKIEEEMGILSEDELIILGDLLRKLGRGPQPRRRERRSC